MAEGRPTVFAELPIWNSEYASCIHYFLYHGQYCPSVQALAAFVNMRLPFQNRDLAQPRQAASHPLLFRTGCKPRIGDPMASRHQVSLAPYIRRLVATGYDSPSVLSALFGNSWYAGVKHILDSERINHLFATKSENWLAVKSYYDMEGGQEIPFLVPLQRATEEQLCEAEQLWGQWLAMGDWMVGPTGD